MFHHHPLALAEVLAKTKLENLRLSAMEYEGPTPAMMSFAIQAVEVKVFLSANSPQYRIRLNMIWEFQEYYWEILALVTKANFQKNGIVVTELQAKLSQPSQE